MRYVHAAAVAALLVSACTDAPGPVSPDETLIAAARPANPPPTAPRSELLVSADWLAKHLNRPDLVVLHFGTAASYNAGHVPGARFVALAPLQPTRGGVPMSLEEPEVLRAALEAAGVSTSSHVVVYGDGILQGARGFFILEYVGHPRVSLLDGGLSAWRASGGAVSTEATVPIRGSMAPPTRGRNIVTTEWVFKRLGDAEVILVDARPFADYAGTVAITPTIPRVGHIPGAHNLPWQQLVLSTADTRLREPEALRALFAPTGAAMGSTVVAYCTSGMMSSLSYFVARYLGYDARLYDGSWFAWSPREELPVAHCDTPWC
jgi:thiosulfate/3-mercaptopyruvate sulfurtransferase